MNGDLASFQGRKLLLIIVNQNNFVPEVDKAPPCHQPNVSLSHNCNMHPLLRLSRKNKFDNYFISFSCGGCANHLPPYWSDTTPIRDDSYSFCGGNSRNSRRRSSLPQVAGFRAQNFKSCACHLLSRSNFLPQKTFPLPLRAQRHHRR